MNCKMRVSWPAKITGGIKPAEIAIRPHPCVSSSRRERAVHGCSSSDPDAPVGAFNEYRKRHSKEFYAQDPKAGIGEIAKRMAQEFHNLTPAEKQRYAPAPSAPSHSVSSQPSGPNHEAPAMTPFQNYEHLTWHVVAHLLRDKDPAVSNAQVSQTVAHVWKQLPEEYHQRFEVLPTHVPANHAAGPAKQRWNNFQKAEHKRLHAERPDMSMQDINKLLSDSWRAMTGAERDEYLE